MSIHKRVFILLTIFCGVIAGCIFVKPTPVSAADKDCPEGICTTCMTSARAVYKDYFEANYATFLKRCQTVHYGGTYGMIYVNSTDIIEISDYADFNLELKRTVFADTDGVLYGVANAYTCTVPSDFLKAEMSGFIKARTAETEYTFSPPENSGKIDMTVHPGSLDWKKEGTHYRAEFNYMSCLNVNSQNDCYAGNDPCIELPLVIYSYRIAKPTVTDGVNSVTNLAEQSDGRYKATDQNGNYSITFQHTINPNINRDIWRNSTVTKGELTYCSSQKSVRLGNAIPNYSCDNPSTGASLTPKYEGTLEPGDEMVVCSALKYPKIVGLDGYAKEWDNPNNKYKFSGGYCVVVYRPKNTFELVYNANGGSGAPQPQTDETSEEQHNFTVSSTEPTNGIMRFVGWYKEPKNAGPADDGDGHYLGGDTITVDPGTTTLYARWDYPEYQATFSANASIGSVSDATLIETNGTAYIGKENVGNYDVVFNGTIKRTDNESNVDKAKAKGKFQDCNISNPTSCSNINGVSDVTADLVINGTKSLSNTAKLSNISKNGSGTVCRSINYMKSATIKNGSQTDGSRGNSGAVCATVYRPTEATFSGSVAKITNNSDSKIVKEGDNYLIGDGINNSFNIKTTYTIKRENSSPQKAVSYYETSNSAKPSSVSNKKTGELASGKTFSPSTNKTKTASQAVGTKGDHCFYLKFQDKVQYYYGGNRLDDRVGTADVSRCTTLYNPMYADFEGDIDATSTKLTGNAKNGFRGNGYDTEYSLTIHFQVKRTDDTPPEAESGYLYDEGKTTQGNGTASKMRNGNVKTISIDVKVTIGKGETGMTCHTLLYDQKVGYILNSSNEYEIMTDPSSSLQMRETASVDKCFYISNPQPIQANFSGEVTATRGDHLTSNLVGDGLRSIYTLTPSATIKRTNGSPEVATSKFKLNSPAANPYRPGDYPISPDKETGRLKLNESETYAGKAKSVEVRIDGSTTQCFYLGFEDTVDYVDGERKQSTFGGKAYKCYTITNPHQSYTAYFSASTSAEINPHDKLNLSNDKLTGVIDNTKRTMGTNTDNDGRYTYDYPSDSNYTATFTHTLSRANDNSGGSSYSVDNAEMSYVVKECLGAACSGNDWTDLSASKTMTLGKGASSSVTETKTFELNERNNGTQILYCQKVAYASSTSYITATDNDNKNGYKNQKTNDYGRTAYSEPVCITLKNPRWTESSRNEAKHYIDVAGEATTLVPNSTVGLISGNAYETLDISASVDFDHKVTRYDNDTYRNNNFDESKIKDSAFYQPSIYRNNAYSVTTQVYGSEKARPVRPNIKIVFPIVNSNFASPNGYEISLNATDKDHGDSWQSDSVNGRTRIIFNATGTGGYGLLAGEKIYFDQGTVVETDVTWSVRYKEIYRKESYVYGVVNPGVAYYNRTEKVDTSPQVEESRPRDSRSKFEPTEYSIERPYNFEITNIDSTSPNPVVTAGQTIPSISYTIDISQQNSTHRYVTDPNHTGDGRYVYVIGYIVAPNTPRSSVQSVLQGTTTSDTNLCARYAGVASSCQVLSDANTRHPKKLSANGDSYNPGNTYNHVYAVPRGKRVGDTIYQLKYNTSSIKVPQSLKVGDKYCIAIAIKNRSSADSGYIVSSSNCVNVAKKPNLHAIGGSIMSNGKIKTSQPTTANEKLFGSWGDFLITANGEISNMASGATMISGASTSSTLCERSPLTISNSKCNATNPSEAKLGNANIEGRTDIIKRILDVISGNISGLSDLPGYSSSTKTYTLNADNTGTDKAYIIRTSEDITISDNIKVEGSYSSIDVPQVVIIAKNIKIDQYVERIDALLVATGDDENGGNIDTCYNYDAEELSSAVCDTPLDVNGAMIARTIHFKRTSGADPSVLDEANKNAIMRAAETINYSPSIYMWGMASNQNNPNPNTTYIKKLPTRY